MWDSVGDHDSGELGVVDVIDSLSAQQTMSDDGDDFPCSILFESLGSLDKGTTGVCHIVDQNRNLPCNITDQDHSADLIWLRPLLVNQRKVEVETICDCCGARCGKRKRVRGLILS